MTAHPPRIPPPPVPALDWTTPVAYLESCNLWLDQMQQWQATTLPEWIDRSRRYLLQQALLNPETRTALPDPNAGMMSLPAQPLLAVPEMRLPSIE